MNMISNSPQKTLNDPNDLWQAISKLVALQNQSPPLQPVPRDSALPLSLPQERLWWLSQLNPQSSAYNISLVFHLTGPLNLKALQDSLNAVVNRHEVLRTHFSVQNDRPVQLISDPVNLDLQVIDLKSLGSDKQKLRLYELITKNTQSPFDLASDLLIRTTLLQLGQAEFVLLIVIHHIVFDGWSEGVLCQELSAAYDAFIQHKKPTFVPLPVQYADFSVWQRQWLKDELQETLLDYWTSQVNDRLAVPELPVQPDSSRESNKFSNCQTLVLEAELTQYLRTFSRQQGVTLFVTLLSGFKVLLHRYCEQDVLMVCTPVANRNRTQLKTLIGYFVNLLLLQTDLSGNPTFKEVLQQVRQTVTGALAHQDLPVQRLVSQLKGQKISVSRVMFALQNTPQHPFTLSGMSVVPWDVEGETTDFDLFLSVVDKNDSLVACLKYNSGLFEFKFIQTLLEHFRQVLDQVIDCPEKSLSSLLDLDQEEQNRFRQQRQARQRYPQMNQGGVETVDIPQNEIERQLVGIWETLLGVRPRLEDNFFDLGGQSLVVVQLLSEIEANFGKKIPLNTLLQSATVKQLSKVIQASDTSQIWPILVSLRTVEVNAKPPLFGIHGIGGGALFYREIAQSLDANIPVYVLQSLGLDGIQTPLERVEDMAELYLQEMRRIQPCGPYYVMGYSFGGFIAFEIAQQLHAVGETVAFLGMLDAPTPDLDRRKMGFWDYALTHFINLWHEKPKRKLHYILNRLKWVQLRKNVNKREYVDKLKSENPKIRMYNVLEPNYRAADRYVTQPYTGHVTVFRAKTQTSRGARYPSLGWDTYAKTVETYTVPGDHYSMIKEPNAHTLGTVLNACIQKVGERLIT